jgi:hypothetical protein
MSDAGSSLPQPGDVLHPTEDVLAFRRAMRSMGYVPLAVHNAICCDMKSGKNPLGNVWQRRAQNDPEEATRDLNRDALNTGLFALGLRIFDFDIDNLTIAAAARRLAEQHFGDTPLIRVRANTRRCALVYRALEPDAAKYIKLKGKLGAIEVQGDAGHQLVVAGMHWSGAEIGWENGSPATTPRNHLPAVSEEQVAEFLAEVAPIINAKALTASTPRQPRQSNRQSKPQVPPSLTEVADALKLIPADDYETWVREGMALWHGTGGSAGALEIWDEWSQTSNKYPGRKAIEDKWASFNNGRDTDNFTLATIFHDAKPYGWIRPDPTGRDPGYWQSVEDEATTRRTRAGGNGGTPPGRPPGPDPESDCQPPSPWLEPVDCFTPLNADPVDVTENEAPPPLWPFIKDTAERMGVATSSVALAAIVTCAAVIPEDWRLQPKRHDDAWTENARLWGAIVGPPSISKTPVLVACTRPVDRLEREAREKWQEEMKDHVKEKAAWRKAKTKAEKRGEEFTDPEPKALTRPRWLVESTTIEALQEVLRDDEQARFTAPAKKVLVRQDELSEFLANLDRYSNGRQGGDRGAYLRLHNGGPYTVDRVGRGAFTASSWSGCLLGGIQPEPIQRIAKQAVDDGLLQRFIYDVPRPQAERGADREPDRDALDRYSQLIPALTNLYPKDRAARAVMLHEDAHVYRESIEELARSMAAIPDISSRLQSAFGKWRGLFARLCLTFHLLEIADARASGRRGPSADAVTAVTAERVACYMRRVLLPHLLRAEAVMFATVQTEHAKWIAGHILARRLDRITTRDVVRAYIALRAPEARDELQSVMASLVSLGWLDPEPPRNPLNPVSAWRINPLVHGMFAERAGQERQER